MLAATHQGQPMSERKSYHVMDATDRKPVEVAVGVLIERDADGREARFLLTSRPEGKVYAGYWEFPGGKLEAGETVEQAANRELKEEVGLGARKLTLLRQITTAPTYMEHHIHLVLAQDLYPERLPGDEPEELEVVPWRLDALGELALREECSEGRSLAALFIVRELLARRA